MKKLPQLFVLPLLTALLACEAGPSVPEVSGPVALGGLENVMRAGNLWFAGQPDGAALEAAREKGIGIVINLRAPSEAPWDEEAAVRDLGMAYHNFPLPGSNPLMAMSLARVEEVVRRNPGKEILIHCGSGNRAGAWYAVHLARLRGVDIDEALAAGRRAGMSSDELAEKVKAYIQTALGK